MKRITVKSKLIAIVSHRAHWMMHLAYFGAAAAEGHGVYSYMAGGLGLSLVVGLIVGVEEHD